MVETGLAIEEFREARFTVRNHKPLRDDRMAERDATNNPDTVSPPSALDNAIVRLRQTNHRVAEGGQS